MAMFGWRSLAEAELYTKAAERKLMAAAGMQFLLQSISSNKVYYFPRNRWWEK
jgi:hypothetical protein